jgi:hypothetical protein
MRGSLPIRAGSAGTVSTAGVLVLEDEEITQISSSLATSKCVHFKMIAF